MDGTSCDRAERVILSGGQGEDAAGFECEIAAESFESVPTILYTCRRAEDDARIVYTAVG
ncbi:MAG: hypothetical protein ACR2KP_06805 [Egibacteraceae bacterium]